MEKSHLQELFEKEETMSDELEKAKECLAYRPIESLDGKHDFVKFDEKFSLKLIAEALRRQTRETLERTEIEALFHALSNVSSNPNCICYKNREDCPNNRCRDRREALANFQKLLKEVESAVGR